MPRTNLVVPTSPVMSGRTRVRAYHSVSFARLRLRSTTDRLRVQDVMLSTSPVIVTLLVGACASAPGVTKARTASTERTTARTLLITASSCSCVNGCTARHFRQQHQQTQTTMNLEVVLHALAARQENSANFGRPDVRQKCLFYRYAI